METAHKLDDVLCLDFEASGIGENTYPIEVGIVNVATLESRTWLIRPTEEWLRTRKWSEEAAQIHKITQQQLQKEGLPIGRVTEELTRLCRDKIVLSDARGYDSAWLHTLYAAAGIRIPPFDLEHFFLFAEELAAAKGKDKAQAIERAKAEALTRFPTIHRAGPDARRNAEVLRLVEGK